MMEQAAAGFGWCEPEEGTFFQRDLAPLAESAQRAQRAMHPSAPRGEVKADARVVRLALGAFAPTVRCEERMGWCYACLVRFAWDPRKAKKNLTKHGVSFDEAKTVFGDELFLVFADPDHSTEECRFIIVGQSKQGRLLVVAYTERSDAIRIISAREATRHERIVYAEEI
jgi:hypothetical protein